MKKNVAPLITYTVFIGPKENLGSRREFVEKLGRRMSGMRESALRQWLGDTHKTRQKRRHILGQLSYNPPPVPLRPLLLREEKLDHCIRRFYRLQINPDDQTEAVLLLPRGASVKSPVPALLGLHEHGGMFLLGKEKLYHDPKLARCFREYQKRCYGEQLPGDFFAANGFAVLCIDQLGFGTRAIWQKEDGPYRRVLERVSPKEELNIRLRMRYEQFVLHRALLAHGYSEAEMSLYDNRRSIDFLQSLPEIDGRRIGAFGLSVGCYQCHELAALDERIKASVRVCWSGDLATMIEADGPRGLGVHFLLPRLNAELHVPEWVALAQGAVLILNGRSDPLYPFAAQERVRRRVARITRAQQRRVVWSYFDGGHAFLPPRQHEALEFFKAHLSL